MNTKIRVFTTKYLLLASIFFSFNFSAKAVEIEPYCKKIKIGEGLSSSLIGNFDIIGKDKTGSAYSGKLSVSHSEETYILEKTVANKRISGKAWAEECSSDKFIRILVKYEPNSKASTFSCYLQSDGDNLIESTCTSIDGSSLEAWFQKHDF